MQPAMTVHTPATSMTLILRSVLTAVTKPSMAYENDFKKDGWSLFDPGIIDGS